MRSKFMESIFVCGSVLLISTAYVKADNTCQRNNEVQSSYKSVNDTKNTSDELENKDKGVIGSENKISLNTDSKEEYRNYENNDEKNIENYSKTKDFKLENENQENKNFKTDLDVSKYETNKENEIVNGQSNITVEAKNSNQNLSWYENKVTTNFVLSQKDDSIPTFKQNGNFRFSTYTRIRNNPSVYTGKVVGSYNNGDLVYYDKKLENEGYMWISYVSYGGERRYVAIKTLNGSDTFGKDSNNFNFSESESKVNTFNVDANDEKTVYKQNGRFSANRTLDVKNSPDFNGEAVSKYYNGQAFYYDEKVNTLGYLWASYISYSGVRRYIAIKNLSNGEEYGLDSNGFRFGEKLEATSNDSHFNQTISGISTNTSNSDKSQAVITIARQQLGKPYQWGGNGPYSFDCSGLVKYVYAQVGVNLPRTTYQQEKMGYEVNLNDVKTGDLLFWGSRGSSYHVGIYTGNGNMLYAPEAGENVKEIPMRYWMPSFARRVL